MPPSSTTTSLKTPRMTKYEFSLEEIETYSQDDFLQITVSRAISNFPICIDSIKKVIEELHYIEGALKDGIRDLMTSDRDISIASDKQMKIIEMKNTGQPKLDIEQPIDRKREMNSEMYKIPSKLNSLLSLTNTNLSTALSTISDSRNSVLFMLDYFEKQRQSLILFKSSQILTIILSMIDELSPLSEQLIKFHNMLSSTESSGSITKEYLIIQKEISKHQSFKFYRELKDINIILNKKLSEDLNGLLINLTLSDTMNTKCEKLIFRNLHNRFQLNNLSQVEDISKVFIQIYEKTIHQVIYQSILANSHKSISLKNSSIESIQDLLNLIKLLMTILKSFKYILSSFFNTRMVDEKFQDFITHIGNSLLVDEHMLITELSYRLCVIFDLESELFLNIWNIISSFGQSEFNSTENTYINSSNNNRNNQNITINTQIRNNQNISQNNSDMCFQFLQLLNALNDLQVFISKEFTLVDIGEILITRKIQNFLNIDLFTKQSRFWTSKLFDSIIIMTINDLKDEFQNTSISKNISYYPKTFYILKLICYVKIIDVNIHGNLSTSLSTFIQYTGDFYHQKFHFLKDLVDSYKLPIFVFKFDFISSIRIIDHHIHNFSSALLMNNSDLLTFIYRELASIFIYWKCGSGSFNRISFDYAMSVFREVKSKETLPFYKQRINQTDSVYLEILLGIISQFYGSNYTFLINNWIILPGMKMGISTDKLSSFVKLIYNVLDREYISRLIVMMLEHTSVSIVSNVICKLKNSVDREVFVHMSSICDVILSIRGLEDLKSFVQTNSYLSDPLTPHEVQAVVSYFGWSLGLHRHEVTNLMAGFT